MPIGDYAKLLQQKSFKSYQRHAGEVEARNVENRYHRSGVNPNAYERAAPWTTQDYPYEQQLIQRPHPNDSYMEMIKALRGQ